MIGRLPFWKWNDGTGKKASLVSGSWFLSTDEKAAASKRMVVYVLFAQLWIFTKLRYPTHIAQHSFLLVFTRS